MESLTVRGELQSIQKVLDYVVTAANQADLDRKKTYHLRLAVDEIATNIVTHGYQAAGRSGNLTIRADFHRDRLVIHLDDTGLSYDPRQTPPPPDLNEPPNKRKTGRLGIFLAMWGVDKFRYQRIKGRNRSTFIMLRARKKRPS